MPATVFHRLTVPSYFGGLPSGYDYVNNAVSGTPAYADGAKAAGPNVGTYFIAFGEDATSSDANRPSLALAQNTDYLDNLLRRDIALPVRTADVGPTGSPTASVLITGPGVFMGNAGALLKDLFHVTDQNDDDILVSGTKIVVTTAVDSGSVPVGGGFSAGNVTITFNVSIPTGTTYHIYYSSRTNFATFPSDGLSTVRIRNAVEVDAQVELLFQLLHGNGEAWNAAWDSTIWDLTAGGLDARYRRSTTGIAGAFNTPGSGAVITRDGPAPQASSTLSTRTQPDPWNALWQSTGFDAANPNYSTLHALGTRTTGNVGSVGSLALVQRVHVQGQFDRTPTIASHFVAWPHYYDATDTHGTPLTPWSTSYTHIPAGALATIQQYSGSTAFFLVTLASTNNVHTFLSTASNATAIAVGRDTLTVSFGGKTKTYVIVSLDPSNALNLIVTPLDMGIDTDVTSSPAACSVVWNTTLMYLGQGAPRTKAVFDNFTPPSLPGGSDVVIPDLDGFFLAFPPPFTTNQATATTADWNPTVPTTTKFMTLGGDSSARKLLSFSLFSATDVGGGGSPGGVYVEESYHTPDTFYGRNTRQGIPTAVSVSSPGTPLSPLTISAPYPDQVYVFVNSNVEYLSLNIALSTTAPAIGPGYEFDVIIDHSGGVLSFNPLNAPYFWVFSGLGAGVGLFFPSVADSLPSTSTGTVDIFHFRVVGGVSGYKILGSVTRTRAVSI